MLADLGPEAWSDIAAGGSEKAFSIDEHDVLFPGGISELGAGVGRPGGDIVVLGMLLVMAKQRRISPPGEGIVMVQALKCVV